MIVSLILTMASNTIWYSFVAYDNNFMDTHQGIEPDDPMWRYTVLNIAPLIFLTIGVILNLNNWIFYYFKIGEMASFVDERAKKHAN